MFAEELRPMVQDTIVLLDQYLKNGSKILVEGANACMLDIDFGKFDIPCACFCCCCFASVYSLFVFLACCSCKGPKLQGARDCIVFDDCKTFLDCVRSVICCWHVCWMILSINQGLDGALVCTLG